MKCIQCSRTFAPGVRARAAISIFVMGDEYIYSYWYCGTCDVYTVESYHDSFLGDDEITFLPPVPRELGDRCVDLIRTCPEPGNKLCDCPSHQALYYGLPRD